MDDKRIRPGVWWTVAAALAATVLVVVVLESRRPGPEPEREQAAPEPAAAARPAPSSETASRDPRPPRRSRSAGPATEEPLEPPTYIEGLVYGDLDLREAKALMPDNLYWKLGSPTKDPEVLAEREEERRRRNEEYGRVLSGDASEEEVDAYYDYKTQLSADYLEFSEFMARRYRDSDNEQFVGMLELAMKMHAERLSELPREREDALARAREREKIREEWRKQQEEFADLGQRAAGEDE